MRIFLAGTNAEIKHKDILKTSPYLLESFYYVKDWQTELIHNCKGFLLDSGAFTFIRNNGTQTDWNEYIKRYANYINENDIKLFFELDIDPIVGYERVKEYRRILEEETGKKSIPVWHKSRGYEEYLNLTKEYNYIAIGGIAIREIKREEYKLFPKMLQDAHRNGCKVHGLGFTNVNLLPMYHFDSVDSTRWNCARFGRIEYFDGKTIRSIDRRKNDKRLKGRRGNVDIIQITLTEWIKYQKYAERHL